MQNQKKTANIIGIIPARMASSRFPGKPLVKICGIPMVGHVYFRSKICKALKEVCVVTCDREIADYIRSLGGKAIMTADTHERASDRTAEALLKIEKETKQKVDIAVMIQGDEPLIYPEMIEASLQPILKDESVQIVNLAAPIKTHKELNDPNAIKVVVDLQDFALYFSREPIPSQKKEADKTPLLKQVCVMPFRRDFLIKFSQLTPTPLEVAESIDMLRVLEHGYKVKMVTTGRETYSVDTIGDLKKAESFMKNDPLFKQYNKAGQFDKSCAEKVRGRE